MRTREQVVDKIGEIMGKYNKLYMDEEFNAREFQELFNQRVLLEWVLGEHEHLTSQQPQTRETPCK